MFKKILICLDGSELAEQILPYAETEASQFASKVVLLQAVPEPIIVSPGIPGAPPVPVATDSLVEEALKADREAKHYLEGVAERLRQKGLQVRAVTMPGMAGQVITTYALQNKMNLIAIATHGRGGLGRAVFGSVADFVLRESELPILMLRPQKIVEPFHTKSQSYKKILVCLDGSKLAEQILPYVQTQAAAFGSELTLFQEVSPDVPSTLDAAPDFPMPARYANTNELVREITQQAVDKAETYLEGILKPLRKKGLNAKSVAVPGEKPAEAIINYATTGKFDLVAIATHGHSGLGCVFFGCVAGQVIKECRLPMLLIKPKAVLGNG